MGEQDNKKKNVVNQASRYVYEDPNDKPAEPIEFVVLIFECIVIFAAIIQMLGFWNQAYLVYTPAAAVALGLRATSNWKKKKKRSRSIMQWVLSVAFLAASIILFVQL